MKRFTLFSILLMLFAALPALAQDTPNLITLNDATPAIDVIITLPADTTGTIALDFTQVSVVLTDNSGAVVFSAADPRLHGIQMNIAPNSGPHTLTVERLPGVTEAYVTAISLPEMTVNGTVQLVEGNLLTLNEEAALALNTDTPGGTVTVNIPAETIGVATASFPGAYATSQLTDAQGVVLAESRGGHVDGLTFVLDTGEYQFTLLSSGLTDTVVAGVRVVSNTDGGFVLLDTPVTTEVVAVDAVTSVCTATVTTSSVSLRSGPGTGYSLLGYGYRGETFEVGGHNPEDNWLVVGTDAGSAWMAINAAQMQGACDALTVFDIPLQDAAPAQIIITSPGSNETYDDDDEHEVHEEHDEHEDEESEHDDD